ncbi:MAG: thioredoxin family protein [Bacteroidales bacterium]
MRKLFISILFMAITSVTFAQMVFENGSWAEVKAMALKNNKLIFIDFYTDWCGPCKQMVKNIFPLPESGDFYNKNFINYKINAEKGEGVSIAKKFNVQSYPTYLFIDGNEKMYYKSGGSMPIEMFLAEGKKALDQFGDIKPIEKWDDEYITNKNDANFLKEYMSKRELLGIENSDILDQYATIANINDILNTDLLKIAISSKGIINAGGPFFNIIIDNLDKVANAIGMSKSTLVYNMPFLSTLPSINKAAVRKNEIFFRQILEGNKKMTDVIGVTRSNLELEFIYYTKTKQGKEIEKIAVQYGDLLLESIPLVNRADNENWVNLLKKVSENSEIYKNKNTDELDNIFTFSKVMRAADHSFKLRDLALSVSTLCEDEKLKQKALEWAFIASMLFKNFSNYEAIAEVYFQLGNNKDGRFWIERCKEIMPPMVPDEVKMRVEARVR